MVGKGLYFFLILRLSVSYRFVFLQKFIAWLCKVRFMAEDQKGCLLGMDLSELRRIAGLCGMPLFAGSQLAGWLYGSGVESIDEMTNLSKQGRAALGEVYTVGRSKALAEDCSVDGTVKYLFPAGRGKSVEAVFIPDGERGTLCVSSQIGCRMGCRFCMTGRQGFEGNLTVGEILNQVYSLPERSKLTNIVFMGQGEPVDNVEAVLKAVGILTAKYGGGMSPRRITISTVGRPGMERFVNETLCHLAVSLHNPFGEERALVVPSERVFGIEDVVGLLRGFDFSHQRRLSFEYTMLRGFNDSLRHARGLLRLLWGLSCRVNLIRFHSIPGSSFEPCSEQTMVDFRDFLTSNGLFTTIRASRGEDIAAACGLLNTKRRGDDC